MTNNIELSPLGKEISYPKTYDPKIIYPIKRQINRNGIGIEANNLPFNGVDIWTCYELSWLNPSGKPVSYVARFYIPCESEFLIESKSFKLYLNSFNNSVFSDKQTVQDLLVADLSSNSGADVKVEILTTRELADEKIYAIYGTCIDDIDVEINDYDYNLSLLLENKNPDSFAEETIFSDLLKSNCPVTGQPDWGSLIIDYAGEAVDHCSLLKYICSLRNHQEFHETCVERIYIDILTNFNIDKLIVRAQYLRRGGLDINPYRSNQKHIINPMRFSRQ